MKEIHCPSCAKHSKVTVLGKDDKYIKVSCNACSFKWEVRKD